MRAGSHTKAWALLQDWLASRGHAISDYHWLCEHVAHWHDPRYSNRLTEDYVDKLLLLKDRGRALDVVRQRLDEDPSFRPKTAAATLSIAELAAQGGGLPASRELCGCTVRGRPHIPLWSAIAGRSSQVHD
jgi:hypothetical protein